MEAPPIRKTVLIVDDDLVLSSMVSEVLQAEGYTVYVEHDGEAGFTRACEVRPEAFVFDVMMPRLTGPQLLAKLRSETWARDVPTLLLSNVNQPEIAPGITGDTHLECLLKTDWTIEQIVEKITSLLAKK